MAEAKAAPAAAEAVAEPSIEDAKGVVWGAIGGAMKAAQLHVGDKMGLYVALRELCPGPGSSTTAVELAAKCSLSVRWVREWCAQQASMGVLQLLDGTGDDDESLRYYFPSAYAEVLANPESPQYDISLIQMVPTLVNRARTTLAESFQTGLGLPYNDLDISVAINRHHQVQIRDCVLPKVLPAAAGGRVLQALETGVRVADLGCGGANLLMALAVKFPKSSFHGYEVSAEALAVAADNVAKSGLGNVAIHNARAEPLGDCAEPFDVVTTLDVLHDAPDPADLIRQVKAALAPGGTWLLADMAGKDGVRENVKHNPAAGMMYAFSTCLCMSCALSEEGGAGLGTLGFGVAVARRMLSEAGFGSVKVLMEEANTRWFEVAVEPPPVPGA